MFQRPAFLAVILVAIASSAAAQTKPAAPASTATNDALVAKVESYLRVLFGWTPDYKVTVGPATPSPIPDLMQIPVSVTHQGHDETGTVYVTKDGRFMVRGEIRDMSKDPFAENRAKIKLGDSPSIGPADAKLTVVEFSDFECPHCQEMYSILKVVEPEFPQVRFVFKNFPLEQLHPWAMTAALAGRCVYKAASSDAFMKFQDTIFENQNAITPDNAWDQITAAAVNAGVSADALHSCMTAPETKAAIAADVAEGKSLGVESTPTFFINGRLFLAADRQSLEDIIRFDLSRQPTKP
ncbi:MAG: thioredoxin domain-containing protein [Candidatus Acidiferrales bacterium]